MNLTALNLARLRAETDPAVFAEILADVDDPADLMETLTDSRLAATTAEALWTAALSGRIPESQLPASLSACPPRVLGPWVSNRRRWEKVRLSIRWADEAYLSDLVAAACPYLERTLIALDGGNVGRQTRSAVLLRCLTAKYPDPSLLLGDLGPLEFDGGALDELAMTSRPWALALGLLSPKPAPRDLAAIAAVQLGPRDEMLERLVDTIAGMGPDRCSSTVTRSMATFRRAVHNRRSGHGESLRHEDGSFRSAALVMSMLTNGAVLPEIWSELADGGAGWLAEFVALCHATATSWYATAIMEGIDPATCRSVLLDHCDRFNILWHRPDRIDSDIELARVTPLGSPLFDCFTLATVDELFAWASAELGDSTELLALEPHFEGSITELIAAIKAVRS